MVRTPSETSQEPSGVAPSAGLAEMVEEENERRGSFRYRVLSHVRGLNVACVVALTGPRSRLDRLTSLADLPVGGRDGSAASDARQAQRRLSDAEVVALASAYRAGADLTQLTKTFGVHRHTSAARLRRLGIPLRRQGIDENDVSKVVRLYIEDGWSLVRLGEQFNCHAETVRQVLKRNGVKLRAPWERS